MTALVHIESAAPETIRARMAAAIGIVSDFRPLYRAMRPAWFRHQRRMYATLGRSTGFPWSPYTQAERQYKTVKAKLTGTALSAINSTLMDWPGGSHRLKRSLTVYGSSECVYDDRTSRNRLTIASLVPYAGKHDRGEGVGPAWAGSPPTPQRRLLVISRSFGTVADSVTAAHIAGVADVISGAVSRLTRRLR